MYFDGRELNSYATPIKGEDITIGDIYFIVGFIDESMLIPRLDPVTFIGRDLEPNDEDCFYFQDAQSYLCGNRYAKAVAPVNTSRSYRFIVCSSQELNGIYAYEHALEILMRCSLDRRRIDVSTRA